MKLKELKEVVGMEHIFNYRKNKKPNQFRFTKSYFYTHGGNEDKFAERITQVLNEKGIQHTIVDKGNNWHSFVGSSKSGSAQDSHWWVVVELNCI